MGAGSGALGASGIDRISSALIGIGLGGGSYLLGSEISGQDATWPGLALNMFTGGALGAWAGAGAKNWQSIMHNLNLEGLTEVSSLALPKYLAIGNGVKYVAIKGKITKSIRHAMSALNISAWISKILERYGL